MLNAPPPESKGYAARSTQLAMRRLDYHDIQRVVNWMEDTIAMREVLPLHVTPREVDVITLIEYADPTGPLMSWAFDLPDGTPVGMGNWREDLPWVGVFHVEVIMSSLAPDRCELVAAAYRLLCRQIFHTLPARKVSAKAAHEGAVSGGVLERVGLVREGVLRKHALLDSKECDLHIFGMTREEWCIDA